MYINIRTRRRFVAKNKELIFLRLKLQKVAIKYNAVLVVIFDDDDRGGELGPIPWISLGTSSHGAAALVRWGLGACLRLVQAGPRVRSQQPLASAGRRVVDSLHDAGLRGDELHGSVPAARPRRRAQCSSRHHMCRRHPPDDGIPACLRLRSPCFGMHPLGLRPRRPTRRAPRLVALASPHLPIELMII